MKEMAPLLHPIPFPEEALKFPSFVMGMVNVLKRFANDQRPEVGVLVYLSPSVKIYFECFV